MIPVYDTKHKSEMLALLTEVFKRSTNINNLLKAIAPSIQQLEDALLNPTTGYVFLIQLANAVGDTLDKIGLILLVPRNGRSDADYRSALYLEIRVLRSMGLAEDIIQIAALLTTGAIYNEYQPAAFDLTAFSVPSPAIFAGYIREARMGGVYGVTRTSSTPRTGHIILGSSTGALADATGFTDAVSLRNPKLLISAVPS